MFKHNNPSLEFMDAQIEFWNQRTKAKLKDLNWTQKDFAAKFKEKYNTSSQSDVSKWFRVGKPRPDGSIIGFPDFSTMKKIANVFGVTLAYLIGESDYQTFEEEQVCTYLNISPQAVQNIKKLTRGDVQRISPAGIEYYYQKRAAVSSLLSAPQLADYIESICELASSLEYEKKPHKYLEKVCDELNPKIAKLAFERLGEAFVDGDPLPPQEVLDAMKKINEAIDADDTEAQLAEPRQLRLKCAKLTVMEAQGALVDYLTASENRKGLVYPDPDEDSFAEKYSKQM